MDDLISFDIQVVESWNKVSYFLLLRVFFFFSILLSPKSFDRPCVCFSRQSKPQVPLKNPTTIPKKRKKTPHLSMKKKLQNREKEQN